jgi:hypothetical protein
MAARLTFTYDREADILHDVAAFLQTVADQKSTAVETIVNDWIRKDIAS